jgi:FtsZ-binding cell division protein ZapB
MVLRGAARSSHHLDETTNTLSFASRAKNIANRPVAPDTGVNVLQQMQQTIRALQEENASLRTRLSTAPPPAPPPQLSASQQPPPAGAPPAGQPTSAEQPAPAPAPRPKIGIAALRGAEEEEVDGLRHEVSTLRGENERLKTAHDKVLKDNQALQAKLARLELIFENGER